MNCIYVLRLGHRPERDKRITTHVALVARAFGAQGFMLEGYDRNILATVKDVTKRWGSKGFKSGAVNDGKAYVEKWKRGHGKVAHLTMYGLNISSMPRLPSPKKLLIVVGAEKVDRWYYDNADYNIAIGNQPHSEVSALAIFLDRLGRGRELDRGFAGAKIRIIPQKAGKKVVGR